MYISKLNIPVSIGFLEDSLSLNQPLIIRLEYDSIINDVDIEVDVSMLKVYYNKFYIEPIKKGVNIDENNYSINILVDVFKNEVIDPSELYDILETIIYRISMNIDGEFEEFSILTLEKSFIEECFLDDTEFFVNDGDVDFRLSYEDFVKILSFDKVSEFDSITFAFNKYGKYIYFEPDEENNKSYVKKI